MKSNWWNNELERFIFRSLLFEVKCRSLMDLIANSENLDYANLLFCNGLNVSPISMSVRR